MARSVVGELFYKLGVDGSELQDSLEGALGSVAAKAAAIGAALFGVKELTGYLGDAITASAEAEKVTAGLAAAFARAGVDGAQAAAEDFKAFAGEVQNVTALSDEIIQQAGALGASFGLTGDALKQATIASADMASVMGVSVQSAMSTLVRSVASGQNALKPFGIEMSASTDQGERLGSLLDGIAEKFGGSAAIATQTFAGRLESLRQSWGDNTEATGAAITQSKIVNAVLMVATTEVQKLTAATVAGNAGMETWVTKGWGALVGATQTFVSVLEVGGKAFAGFKIAGNLAIAGIIELFDTLMYGVARTLDGFRSLAEMAGLDSLTAKIDGVRAGMAAFREGVADTHDVFLATAADGATAWDAIGTTADKVRMKVAELDSAVRSTAATISTKLPAAAQTAAAGTVAAMGTVRSAHEEAAKALAAEFGAAARGYEMQAAAMEAQALAYQEAQRQNADAAVGFAATAGKAFGDQAFAFMVGTGKMTDAFKAFGVTAIDAVEQVVVKAIMAYAAEAAAAAASSQAGIPVVGPVLAGIAATAMFAMVRGFLTKFHDGGMVGGSTREVPALLERGEYVFTADQTRGLMDFLGSMPRAFSRPAGGVYHEGGLVGSSYSGGGQPMALNISAQIGNPSEMSDEQIQRWLIKVSRHAEALHRDGLFLQSAAVAR